MAHPGSHSERHQTVSLRGDLRPDFYWALAALAAEWGYSSVFVASEVTVSAQRRAVVDAAGLLWNLRSHTGLEEIVWPRVSRELVAVDPAFRKLDFGTAVAPGVLSHSAIGTAARWSRLVSAFTEAGDARCAEDAARGRFKAAVAEARPARRERKR